MMEYRCIGFNTQPPEGGWPCSCLPLLPTECFNTQPPEGGWELCYPSRWFGRMCFNTQPPEGGWEPAVKPCAGGDLFQHTAARRRLVKNF